MWLRGTSLPVLLVVMLSSLWSSVSVQCLSPVSLSALECTFILLLTENQECIFKLWLRLKYRQPMKFA